MSKEGGLVKDIKRMVMIGAIVSVSVNFSLNLFTEGFIITLSVVVLSILLYKNQDLNPVCICFVTGIMSPLFRLILVGLEFMNLGMAFYRVWPDVMFYFTFGIIYYFIYYRRNKKDLTRFGMAVLVSDFLSNIVEMSIRDGIFGLDQSIVKALFVVAGIRTIIVISTIILLQLYESFLAKQEHEKRYKKLVMLTSVFESETYFMNKNMQYIENIMKKIFKAHRLAIKEDLPMEFQELVLDIAKDTHEIKKEYLMVLRGLEQIFTNKFKHEKMHINDIINILQTNMGEYIKTLDNKVIVNYKVKSNIVVKEHYYLMSILRNLINNSIEATEQLNEAIIDVFVEDMDDQISIRVRDNGKGIKENHLDYIFKQGFSTKFNEETGDISRGLGLTIVSHLVSEVFGGNVDLSSEINKGTEFKIVLDKKLLEGDCCENIHS